MLVVISCVRSMGADQWQMRCSSAEVGGLGQRAECGVALRCCEGDSSFERQCQGGGSRQAFARHFMINRTDATLAYTVDFCTCFAHCFRVCNAISVLHGETMPEKMQSDNVARSDSGPNISTGDGC